MIENQKVILTESEVDFGTALGRAFTTKAKLDGYTPNTVDVEHQDEIDISGKLGEFAFCKEFNIWPEINHLSNDQKGWDCRFENGILIDVKTIREPHHRLIVNKSAQMGADVYALVLDQCPEFTILGWTYMESIINDEHFIRAGTGGMKSDCWGMRQTDDLFERDFFDLTV